MAVIRVEKNDNFTTMSNYHLRDPGISLRAVGLLSKMLSLPPEWDYTVAGLAAICKEGRDAIRGALQELEAAGYMRREQTHNEAGHFSSNDYVIYEHPPLTAFPSTVKPSTGSPLTVNPTEINIDINNNILNNPPKAPQGGRRKKKEVKENPDWKPERFAGFWAFYPRGEAKQRAIEAWDKARLSDNEIAKMGRRLKDQMSSEEWKRGVGIPYASTYLNQRRWEDEDKSSTTQADAAASTGSWAPDPEVMSYAGA